MSTRRWQTPMGEVTADHGAQYFTARDPDFKRLVRGWSDMGIAERWSPAGAEAWVGVPGMSAVLKQMASSHEVSWSHLVKSLARRNDGCWLVGEQGETGPFDAAVLAIPAEQAASILALHDFTMMRAALMARSQPCWTGMFVFDRPLDELPAVIRDRKNITWAARNNSKPGRPAPECWIVHASALWSREKLEDTAEHIADLLFAELYQATGSSIPRPVASAAHRWRYALSAGTGEGALWNSDLRLGVCGDWLLGPRVECAWLSGRMLAQRCLLSIEEPSDS